MFTLTLNNRCLLKKEINAMRQQRLEAENDYVWNIALQNGKDPILYVHAIGSTLWVTEYSVDNMTWNKFEKIYPNFSMNYREDDKGCLLAAASIIELIKSFAELVKNNSLGNTEKRRTIRDAYVMIVYVSSEMIKNEILQKALDNEYKLYSWAKLLSLYKNCSKISMKLYNTHDSYYQTIYIKDFAKMSKQVYDDPDIQDALDIINSLGVYINPTRFEQENQQ